MRLEVQGYGSVMLIYPWSQEGASSALPRIQQIFKRWNVGQITLAAAAQKAGISSSHQKLGFNKLFEKYRKFVPNTGDTTWRYNYLPVLKNLRVSFEGKPPVGGETLAMECLKQWERGSRM